MTQNILPTSVHPNGVRIIWTHSDRPLISIVIGIHAGSAREYANERGGAHLLEHLCMRASTEFDSEAALKDALSVSGSVSNALTSHDHTLYYVTGLATKQHVFIPALLSAVFHPDLDSQSAFATEKGAVIAEIHEQDGSAESKAFTRLHSKVFTHGYSRNVTGSVKDVKRLRPQDLKRFHRRNYVGSNVVIAVSGKVEPETWKLIHRVVKKIPKKTHTYGSKVPTWSGNVGTVTTATDPNSTLHSVSRYYRLPHEALTRRHHAVLMVLNHLIGHVPTGKLFTELRDKRGLVYSAYCREVAFDTAPGLIVSYQTLPENASKVSEVVNKILAAPECSESNLAKVKEDLKGLFVWGRDDLAADAMSNVVTDMAYGSVLTPESLDAMIDDVTVNDVLWMWDLVFSRKPNTMTVKCPKN